jgi:uncharacterized membrane protein
MDRKILRWLPEIVLAATLAYTLSVYASLPARMATHWGINGQPNGWSPRAFGAWLLPGMMVLTRLVFATLPRIDPRKANYEKFGVVYDLLVTAILTFMAVIQVAMLNVAQGHAVDINTVVYVSLGALFAAMGLAMPFLKPTWFVGIRTPWTLSDDNVWARTHKTGGFLMVTAGALTIVAALTAPPHVALFVLLASSAVAALGSVLLSYLYWRQR